MIIQGNVPKTTSNREVLLKHGACARSIFCAHGSVISNLGRHAENSEVGEKQLAAAEAHIKTPAFVMLTF